MSELSDIIFGLDNFLHSEFTSLHPFRNSENIEITLDDSSIYNSLPLKPLAPRPHYFAVLTGSCVKPRSFLYLALVRIAVAIPTAESNIVSQSLLASLEGNGGQHSGTALNLFDIELENMYLDCGSWRVRYHSLQVGIL